MNYNFLKTENETTYFTGVLMEIYIPKEYFNLGFATRYGNKINTLGIFNFIVYSDVEDRKDTSGKLYNCNLPVSLTFQYEETFNSKNIRGKFKDSYDVFVLKTGDIFMENINKERSANDTESFVFRLNSGKLPKTCSYDDIQKLFMDNLDITDKSLGNPAVIYEMLISALYRDKDDETIPFRQALNENPRLSLYDYNAVNITQLPAIQGTFQALMFENIKQSMLYSLLRGKKNLEEEESPIEKVIKY